MFVTSDGELLLCITRSLRVHSGDKRGAPADRLSQQRCFRDCFPPSQRHIDHERQGPDIGLWTLQGAASEPDGQPAAHAAECDRVSRAVTYRTKALSSRPTASAGAEGSAVEAADSTPTDRRSLDFARDDNSE
jgi:hypothetical protein